MTKDSYISKGFRLSLQESKKRIAITSGFNLQAA